MCIPGGGVVSRVLPEQPLDLPRGEAVQLALVLGGAERDALLMRGVGPGGEGGRLVDEVGVLVGGDRVGGGAQLGGGRAGVQGRRRGGRAGREDE